ncbi:hypothetical protein BUALT_Bualt15G0012000 [Buddleja alternifolia]|uniref:Dirigent protein n=1 Tax=Buddleja alternifolia TaxID=168488 RepID=A0AAV6WJU8_9LAMI|nr:hypothetical protein BUALT_Bualt15G0012000 [Buddleja alternifolia]
MDKICTILMLFSAVNAIAYANNIAKGPEALEKWFKNLPNAKEKVTKLHFYFHDIVGGENPTAIVVAQSNSTILSPTFFGFIRMMDNALTVGPELGSKIVGRAQGIYGSASFKEMDLLMTLNYVFTDGKYNGSSISVLGHNPILHEYREMPIVGGSGVFRMARGIATAQTVMFNDTSGDAVVEECNLREAVNTLPLLSRKGFRLNSKIIASLIQQSADAKSIKEGQLVHLHLKLTGFKHPTTFLSNHLINMYAKCGDHVKAREVFDKMRVRNLYSWNNMISGYANNGMARAAKRLFDRMPQRDCVSWNTMAMAYVQSGCFDEALRCFMELRRLGIGFNEYSFAGVLTACVKLRDLWLVKQLHCQVLLVGFFSNVVLSSSVMDAYVKCGEMGDARRLFDEMRKWDVLAWTTLVSGYARVGDMKSSREIFDAMPGKNYVSWNALIAGYTQNGMGNQALKLFVEMIMLNVKPDQFTISSCLSACGSIISLGLGRQLHSHLITSGIRPNVVIVSSLIDMYAKCGSLEAGKRVFDTTDSKQHIVLWNTMMSALADIGCGKLTIKIFIDMVRLGVKPEKATFLVLLNACNRSMLVQEGLHLFESIMPEYNIIPDQEHYACLIDLLGRSGFFDELMNQLKKMPVYNLILGDRVWNALIGVCRSQGNIELGRVVAKHLVELEPRSSIAYLLLSVVYAALGRWESAEEVRKLMKAKDMEKELPLSWLEVDRKLHLDIQHNKLDHPDKETSLVMYLLVDRGSLYNVKR